ncbi:MAG TPA: hypothetical protein VNJ08_14910 [Bacteriovoracaceae bacterium]|nr:hypothetical protein [Bacteriovoracaceae bacterium]
MKTIVGILIGTSLLGLVSCGGNKSSSPTVSQLSKEPSTEPEKEEIIIEDDHGIFKADLHPIAGDLVGQPTGSFTVSYIGETLKFEAEVFGVASDVMHFQTIHAGSACPGDNADVNLDGVVDGVEGTASYGLSLIPVDFNLMTQIEGMEFGPIANEEGYYTYRKKVPFQSLMSDLTAEDNDIEDNLVKILPEQKLKMSDRVVVIYGVSRDTVLPATFSSVGEMQGHESVPVACGRLVRQ